ncbi:hypothetical protein UPYG_G00254710 [Umbra pygmaea]|uniref:Protein C10 n=2 Tax=Clupeocephala TaxID=186625 RepID=A0ABD0WTN5_UMBPY
MASAPAQQPTLTVEQARVVLSEVIQAFSVPENAARMEEARESACNDMGKMLQLVLPVATQIQQEVIKAYGFNNEGEGVLKFARLVKMYETQDPEIAAMSAKLKSLLLPPLSTPPIGGPFQPQWGTFTVDQLDFEKGHPKQLDLHVFMVSFIKFVEVK